MTPVLDVTAILRRVGDGLWLGCQLSLTTRRAFVFVCFC